MGTDRDYVLGTHDAEIERLGLQHRVWRPRALDAWRRAGFTAGQTLLDVGCGPGYAALDLAEIAGPSGRVVAIDRSRRFLDTLESACGNRRLNWLQMHELDLDEGELPVSAADGAWARWVFAFVKKPQALLTRVAAALRPGGVLVLHEYFDYSTWRLAPRCPEIEDFVQQVMTCWRADGGEPDIGLQLPTWLADLGFDLRTLQPLVDVVPPTNFVWQWPRAFLEVGLRRLVDLGQMTASAAERIWQAFLTRETTPHTLLITPAVLEIIAVKK
jgi:SAM-dependent methyltransferase